MQRQDDASDLCKAVYAGNQLSKGAEYIEKIYRVVHAEGFDPASKDPSSESPVSQVCRFLNLSWSRLLEVTHTLKRLSPEAQRDLRPVLEEEVGLIMHNYDAAAEKLPILEKLKHSADNMGAYGRLERILEILEKGEVVNPDVFEGKFMQDREKFEEYLRDYGLREDELPVLGAVDLEFPDRTAKHEYFVFRKDDSHRNGWSNHTLHALEGEAFESALRGLEEIKLYQQTKESIGLGGKVLSVRLGLLTPEEKKQVMESVKLKS